MLRPARRDPPSLKSGKSCDLKMFFSNFKALARIEKTWKCFELSSLSLFLKIRTKSDRDHPQKWVKFENELAN